MTRLGAASCLLLLAALGACSDDGDSSARSVTEAASTAESHATASANALPDGIYRTAPLTADDIRAAASTGGFSDDDAAAVTDLFSSSVVWEVTLGKGRWTESEIYDEGPAEVGWQGTYDVTDDHTVVATEDSGGAITYRFTLTGDELSVSSLDVPGDDRDNLLHQTVIYQSGPFTRQDAVVDPERQTVSQFVPPFTIQLADWLDPTPSQVSETFVTWEAPDHARGLRVMTPVEVYRPGQAQPSAPPADLAQYLLSLADSGAEISDVTDTDVDGLAATEMTIGLGPEAKPSSLDGAIGCPAADLAADICFGPQDELLLRLVVTEVHDSPVLIWERDPRNDADAIADGTFDAMVASIRLTGGRPAY